MIKNHFLLHSREKKQIEIENGRKTFEILLRFTGMDLSVVAEKSCAAIPQIALNLLGVYGEMN